MRWVLPMSDDFLLEPGRAVLIDRDNDLWRVEDKESLSYLTPWGWVRHKFALVNELFGPLHVFGGDHAKAFVSAEKGSSKLTDWMGW